MLFSKKTEDLSVASCDRFQDFKIPDFPTSRSVLPDERCMTEKKSNSQLLDALQIDENPYRNMKNLRES